VVSACTTLNCLGKKTLILYITNEGDHVLGSFKTHAHFKKVGRLDPEIHEGLSIDIFNIALVAKRHELVYRALRAGPDKRRL